MYNESKMTSQTQIYVILASLILNDIKIKRNLLWQYDLNAKQKSLATKRRICLTWLFGANI